MMLSKKTNKANKREKQMKTRKKHAEKMNQIAIAAIKDGN